MADLIAKKREMFLVQMSLDTKRKEIQKLEEKAKLKEEALRKSELMLEADAARFDKFLKENDRNAHEAIKRHDDESKIKHEKLAEIKKLNQEIAKVQGDMSKYQEQLEDCLKYKEFLDKLTPHAEKEAMEKARLERLARKASKQAEAKAPGAEGGSPGGTGGETGAEDDDDEVEPIYFKEPSQLLQIFSALEERNLFLIQNSQETEEALEDLKNKFEETKSQMEANTSALSKNIEQLQTKIELENEKAARLEKRISVNVGIGKQEAILQELGDKVTEVFTRCGFVPEANPDTLDKLVEIERKLEQLLTQMSVLPKDYIRAAEKRKEADRRDRVRKQKMFEKQHAYEERLAKSVARATKAIPQRKGKKIMFRSPPLKRVKKKATVDDKIKLEQDIMYKKYFT
ncbi:DUF4200 domain-containing protein [Plasmodiophora brassicae]|nr:hypothetical protein PBRA_001534 [Plasmodiophora brassicae]